MVENHFKTTSAVNTKGQPHDGCDKKPGHHLSTEKRIGLRSNLAEAAVHYKTTTVTKKKASRFGLAFS
jgi:hypothetical protein